MSNIAVIEKEIYALKPVFESVAVDKGIVFEREAEFALQIMSANPYLQNIAVGSIQSFKDAITNVSAIGLTLNPARKQAYLVPRKGKVCLDISYMGLIDMALSTGSVLWAQASVVYTGDTFTLHGYDKPPSHDHDPFAEDRGEKRGVYVVAKTRDGDYLTHCMSIAKVNSIRDRSEAWKSYVADNSKKCPWVTDAEEMEKKTCIKQASKYWPKTERLERAVQYLNTVGDEGIELSEPHDHPSVGKPAVTMPTSKKQPPAMGPDHGVSDAEPKPPQAAQQETPTDRPASVGEVKFIKGKLDRMGLGIPQALEAIGSTGDTLEGITLSQFNALKALKAPQ